MPGNTGLENLEILLSNSANTEKILLQTDNGETLKIYNGYKVLSSIEKQKNALIGYGSIAQQADTAPEEVTPIHGDLVIAVLQKETIEHRVTNVEQQITDTQMAITEIYEGMA